ncbi:MAG: glycogen/starch synthase, partial [Paludibacteraceae bacterium]|nr:glycogen/starch synthase [Paludibacteraceae bacterium]
RCIFFARGVLETVKKLRWTPDVICCQGWMSALAPLYIKKVYNDDPFFKDAKVVLSLQDQDFKQAFKSNFAQKILMDGISESDLQTINQKEVDFVSLMKLATDYSDAVIKASKDVEPQLVEYAASKQLPYMDFPGEENYQAYIDFYNGLL